MLAVLRIVTALLFMQHALMKLFSIPAPFPGVDMPLHSLLQVTGWIELTGAPLLLVGLFSRPVAFILSGEMAVAYSLAHAPMNFWPILNLGEPAILYCFVFLYFVFAGPGAWSLDALYSGLRPVPPNTQESCNRYRSIPILSYSGITHSDHPHLSL